MCAGPRQPTILYRIENPNTYGLFDSVRKPDRRRRRSRQIPVHPQDWPVGELDMTIHNGPGPAESAGVILDLERENGVWKAETALVLPDAPVAFGFTPDGTLLIADARSSVAVLADSSIVPLECNPPAGPDPSVPPYR